MLRFFEQKVFGFVKTKYFLFEIRMLDAETEVQKHGDVTRGAEIALSLLFCLLVISSLRRSFRGAHGGS